MNYQVNTSLTLIPLLHAFLDTLLHANIIEANMLGEHFWYIFRWTPGLLANL